MLKLVGSFLVLALSGVSCADVEAQAVPSASTSIESTERIVRWANERNAVMAQILTAPARLATVTRELLQLLEAEESPDQLDLAFDRAVERLSETRDQLDAAVTRLTPPPAVSGNDSQMRRLEESWRSIAVLHARVDDLLAHAISALATQEPSEPPLALTLRVMNLDAEIALLEANIQQKQSTRSNDPANPGSFGNLAGEHVLRSMLDINLAYRDWIAREGLPDAEALLERFTNNSEAILSAQTEMRRAADDQVANLEAALADMDPSTEAGWINVNERARGGWLTFHDSADLLVESAGVLESLTGEYREAASDEQRVEILSGAAERLNQITIYRNEMLARRGQMFAEVMDLARSLVARP